MTQNNNKDFKNNLRQLQQIAFQKPIANPLDTDLLSQKLESIKEGDGHVIMAELHKDNHLCQSLDDASNIISNMTHEKVTMIALNAVKIKNAPSVISDYQEGLNVALGFSDFEKENNKKIYMANSVEDISIENSMSFGDDLSREYKNYNVSAHMKFIDHNNKNILKEEVSILMSETKNPIAVNVDLNLNTDNFSKLLSKDRPDVLVFKMEGNSKQKLGYLLDGLVGLEIHPILCCDPMRGKDIDAIKTITTEFIESCRERDLHPGGFVYSQSEIELNTDQFESVILRLADDLVRPIEPLNKKNIDHSVSKIPMAWS